MNKELSKTKRTIIVAPLDWGFGHATRMIPIVNWLSKNNTVIVAAPKHLQFLFNSELKIVTVKGYNIQYFKTPLWFSFLIQMPRIIGRALKTKNEVRKICKEYQPDLIISDNRPFFRHSSVKSVYITHQINIPHKIKPVKKAINRIHHLLIHKFDECWIPDTCNHFFAGELSTGVLKIPVRFLGGLSRFQLAKQQQTKKYERVCVLSGPEPAKSNWAKAIYKKWKKKNNSLVIGALKGKDKFQKAGKLTLASHLNDDLFLSIISRADLVFTRSGYSSIMDLMFMQKNAFLIPTPGQGEQQYLATYHRGKYFLAGNTTDDYQTEGLKPIDDSFQRYFCNEKKLENLIESIL